MSLVVTFELSVRVKISLLFFYFSMCFTACVVPSFLISFRVAKMKEEIATPLKTSLPWDGKIGLETNIFYLKGCVL